jgi:cyclopropane-fatty-acyl-phospholipid synthase
MATQLNRYFQAKVLERLVDWRHGVLCVRLPDGSEERFGREEDAAPVALDVHDSRFFGRLLIEPDVGVGESYVAGEWSSPNLPALIAAYIRNAPLLRLDSSRWLGAPLRAAERARQRLRRNTRSGSERNIHAHYDLGNDFFRLFLDDSLAYSCAVFPTPESTLEEAQLHKFRMICDKLRLGPDDHLLDIGCGWGGLALFAARERGCRVTAVTISREQYELTRERVREAALESRVEVRYCDYRDIQGEFDKIVSIEMLEAVGVEYWDDFFAAVDALLAPNGLALIQVISVPDQRFAAYVRSSGWIRKHIFPGGILPSLYELQRSMRRVTSLELHDLEDIGLHYARTLGLWRERFWKNVDRVRSLGFGDAFVRTWDYYLALCQGAFAAHENRDLQLLLTRPQNELMQEQAHDG